MSNEIKTTEKNISDLVLTRVNQLSIEGGLIIPKDYSAANALKSAWLILQETKDRGGNPVLTSCTQPSIANSLLDMVVQGLSPSKKQCYFIPYGGQLQLSRSYMGTVAVVKRLEGIKNVFANCVYENDVFDYEIDPETGIKRIIKHEQSFENIDITKIKGAYAVVVIEGSDNYIEIMTISQIKKAWGQGAAKGNSGAHNNFTDEMAKKTVINRACKIFANTSSDSELFVESFNRTTETDYPEIKDVKYAVLNDDDAAKMDELNKIMQGEPEPPKRKQIAKLTSKVEEKRQKNAATSEDTEAVTPEKAFSGNKPISEISNEPTEEEKQAILVQEALEAKEEMQREAEALGIDYEN